MGFLKSQIARYAGGLPLYAVPQLSGTPYVGPDVQPGDVIDFVDASQASVVYPAPVTTHTVFSNGVNVGSTPYTVTSGDVTAGNLTLKQRTGNALGFVEATSSPVNPIAVQTAAGQGLLGGNTSGTTHYSVQQFLNNAGQAVRQPFYAYNNTSANYSGSLDANGWPTSAFTVLLSAQIGGLDGQLPAGTYQCSYRSVGQASAVSALQGCSISGTPTQDVDGVTTHFTLVIPFAQNPCLSFSGGIQYLDIPRDGVTLTYGGPEFWSTNLAFWAQQSVLRLMDLCNCTGSETLWSQRTAAYPEYGVTQPSTSYSLARIARWIKAVVQYPGSKVKTVIFNAPGLMNTSATLSDNIAQQLPTLLNSILSGVNVQLLIELGDEPWNASLGAALVYRGNLNTMESETKCLPYYVGEASNISSIVGNGDGTVTVTLGAGFTGAINGTQLSLLTSSLTGNIWVGQPLSGAGVAGGTTITGAMATVNTGGVTGVAGNSFVTGVSWAPTAVVGQIVSLSKMGSGGADLVTTVAPGSSGTTLNIANVVVTSAAGTSTLTATTATVSTSQTVASQAMNTAQALSAVPLPDGSTFSITNGMSVVVNHQQSNTTWGAGSIVPYSGIASDGNPSYAADGTVNAVTVTTGGALSANQFKYTANGSPSTTLGAASGSNQMAFFFGLTSNLLKDGISLNLFDLGNKVQVRRTYQCQQIWSQVRPQDKFVLNLQQYGLTAAAAMTNSKFAYGYARYLGGGSDAWLYGTMVAPYVKPTGLPFTGAATIGGTTVTGVPWASTAVVGDQISIPGAGASSATLTTTVTAGSSGTTLNIADTISTTVTAGTINYVYGPSASVTASISGTTMTVTSGSGLMVGMMGNGTPATMAFNTRIVQQLTGTAGGVGTYQLSTSQTLSSQTMTFAQTDGLVNAMLANVPNFGLTLAGHIYTSLRWGKRPIVYEGGPDTQSFANQQVAIHTNPAMGTVYTALLDAWFNQGGQEFCAYTGAAAVFTNTSQGEWSALQSYSDTSSPKYAALIGYSSRSLSFADAYEPGLVFGPSGSPGSYVKGISQSEVGWQGFYSTGMLGCAGSGADRSIEVLRNIPRGRRYAIKVTGSDSAAGTTGDIYIDGVFKGTVTLPPNGSGASVGTTPGDSTTLQLGELTRGAHRIKVDFPAGRGTNVGVFSITLMKY